MGMARIDCGTAKGSRKSVTGWRALHDVWRLLRHGALTPIRLLLRQQSHQGVTQRTGPGRLLTTPNGWPIPFSGVTPPESQMYIPPLTPISWPVM
jgi:hypothetical protein